MVSLRSLVLTACLRACLAGHHPMTVQLTAAEVPGGGMAGSSGSVGLVFAGAKLCYELALDFAPTRMHIHTGDAGASGAVVVSLFDALADPAVAPASSGCVTMDNGELATILGDPTNYYVNVHSEASPNGAVRGQLAESTQVTVALDGANVPGGGADATGAANLYFSEANNEICFAMSLDEVTPTAMHLHTGAAGATGGVAVIFEVVKDGEVQITGCTTVPAAARQLFLITPEFFYLNVHSAEFSDGAVRGQLPDAPVTMPANTMLLLDGSQIPDDAGSKTAVGAVRLAFYDTQVCYYLATNETLTKLHIHADGGSVGVVFEVGSTFGCTQTTADAVDDILKNPSFYYLNAHTDAFPGGAMRADLYAPASMTLLLRGSEVPDGAGSTTGSGSIALSYYNTKVCFMLEVSDDVTPKSMNIHSGLVGESGGPVVTFSQVASGSLSGCVDNSDGTIETILYSPSSFYVNLHSVEFPGGAIRGQAAAPAAMSTLLEGSQVAPQEGNLAGSGDVELSFYKTKVCFQLTVSADVAAPTSMHIHSGLAGAGGDVVVALSTGALQGCVVTPLPAVLTHVLQYADHFYLNVHTGDFASGAIRGQLAAPAEMKFTLDAKQVPDHDKHDEGAGVIYVALYNTKVCFTLVSTASVMGIASMHIHAGAEGKTGGVVVDFADRTQFAFDDGETNAGCADNFDGAIGQILQDPYAYYFNVHTEEKPGGSIRGQLKPPATMLVKVDGAQVVGDGTTTGFGLVQLHYYQQKVCFSLHSQGVSATSMHIHSGVSGASGGVALAFGDFITEASTDGGFDVDRGCADYTAALIEVVLSAPAAFYFQAHSAAFPGGAVRGQLESNAEMSIPLEGSQVAPGSGSTTASGNIELFFYNQKVCFMLEVAGLTPTAMHVHSGVAGAGGGVVVDFPHVAEGLLEGCVVTTPTAALLDPAAFYVNVHSAEFPNGALRGQLFFEACTSEGQYPYYCTEAEAAANSPKGTGHGHDRLFMPDGGADNVHDGSYGGDAPQCKCDQRPKPPHDDDHDHSATTPKPTPAPTDGTATAAPTPAAGSSSGAASLRTSATAVIASALLVALFGTQ